MEEILLKNVTAGQKFNLGIVSLSETEIIDFAEAFDPLDFHVNKEAAKKTIFKGLIASGPHIFNYIYRKEWLPRVGKTVICGLGISNWKFIKPVYPDQKVYCEVVIVSMVPDSQARGVAITWQFEFRNEKVEMMQILQTEILHCI